MTENLTLNQAWERCIAMWERVVGLWLALPSDEYHRISYL